MSSNAIEIKNLSKKYIISHQNQGSYLTLRDTLVDGVKNIGKKKPAKEEFWALKDVGFQVKQGDRLGIIGRNGAGKSTILKILSRITEPTSGTIKLRGRVASLLEVGTGFNAELTGRENIFLNGAILGMGKKEIERKFDEIVAFSEVEQFLDTPVKRYSSGMHMRLAFAVAAHLDSEILLVDEVLAVGDVQFQKKCLGKMEEIGQNNGRTILFVSHNMTAVEQLCNSCILLEEGKVVEQSCNVKEVLNRYAKQGESDEGCWENKKNQFENEYFQPIKFYLKDSSGKIIKGSSSNDQDIWVHVEGNIDKLHTDLDVGVSLYSMEGVHLFWTFNNDTKPNLWPEFKVGLNHVKVKIPKRTLNEGNYRIELLVAVHNRPWICQPNQNAPALYFSIKGGLSDSPYWISSRPGALGPEYQWFVE